MRGAAEPSRVAIALLPCAPPQSALSDGVSAEPSVATPASLASGTARAQVVYEVTGAAHRPAGSHGSCPAPSGLCWTGVAPKGRPGAGSPGEQWSRRYTAPEVPGARGVTQVPQVPQVVPQVIPRWRPQDGR